MLENCLEKYMEACIIHGKETEISEDYKTVNKAHGTIIKNFRILVKDENGIEMLKNLLKHEDIYISSWTACLLIFDYPKECKKIIKSVAKRKGIYAITIKTFYKEWKKGNLKRIY